MQKFIDPDELLKYGACPSECRGGYGFCTTEDHIRCAMRIYDLDSIDNCPKVSAIPLDSLIWLRESIATHLDNLKIEDGSGGYDDYVMRDEVLELIDKLLER